MGQAVMARHPENDVQDGAQGSRLGGLGVPLDADGGSDRRLAPSPGGRAGVLAAAFDYLGAHPRARARNGGSERTRDGLSNARR